MTIAELAQRVMEYESDTFSAEDSIITEAEATAIAEKLLEWWAEENIDGVSITQALDEVR